MTQTEKYIWLLNTIHRAGEISLKDLSERWKEYMSTEKPLDRATFNRWKEAIGLQWDVNIDCKRRGGYKYYISNPDEIDKNKLKKWLVDSFSVGNALMDALSIKERIFLEQIPSGHTHLTTIVSAMKGNRKLEIEYRGFGKTYSSRFHINPLCLKLYKNRWYVVGENCYYGEWRKTIYGLDRIENVHELSETFTMPEDFDAEEYFADYIGVLRRTNVTAKPIRIRVWEPHKYYIMSLPIHHSQRLIDDKGEYAEFELTLAPTEEFFIEMLHGGSWIEVLSPPKVVEQMKEWVNELYNVYNN